MLELVEVLGDGDADALEARMLLMIHRDKCRVGPEWGQAGRRGMIVPGMSESPRFVENPPSLVSPALLVVGGGSNKRQRLQLPAS
jgi:hypothetical protein